MRLQPRLSVVLALGLTFGVWTQTQRVDAGAAASGSTKITFLEPSEDIVAQGILPSQENEDVRPFGVLFSCLVV